MSISCNNKSNYVLSITRFCQEIIAIKYNYKKDRKENYSVEGRKKKGAINLKPTS